MVFLFYIFTFILGACLGSFLCCQARRLHLHVALKVSKKGKKKLSRRSVCLHCHHQLKWYDNLPLISWLLLRGRCRHCHLPIGLAELLSELSTAFALPLIFTPFSSTPITPLDFSLAAPLDWLLLIITVIFICLIIFLAIYDGLYGELPTIFLILSIVCALTIAALKLLSTTQFTPTLLLDSLLAVCILGGLYLVLYLISRGRWVGDGDWLLGTALALVLGSPWLAFTTLFLANFLACLAILPLSRRSPKIHLGPFLVGAFIIAYSFSTFFLNFML